MHLFAENLAIEIAQYYRNLALAHGAIPKIFTLVNGEGDQYLFFIDDLMLDPKEVREFLSYIVHEHEAVCYAQGTLVILDKTQQLIEFAVIDEEAAQAIVCSAELTRDLEDRPVGLTEFDKILAPKKTIFFGGLFTEQTLSEDKRQEFEELWIEMKPKILHRTMGI